jgi:hypothetical protein
VDVLATLVAGGEPAELVEPRERAFDHPPMTPEAVLRLDPLARDPGLDPAPAEELPAAGNVVGLVGMQRGRAFARPTTRLLDRGDGVDQVLEDDRLVAVGAGDEAGERGAAPVRNNVALRARFAAIRRVPAGGGAPLFAGTLAASRQARLQSIWSASPSRSSSARCSRSQTPSTCQSRSRRQHVMPDPQPSSAGSISQGMPLLSTKMIPVKQARSGTRGRPPFGFDCSFGSNGSTMAHSSSLTSGLLMPSRHASPVPQFC